MLSGFLITGILLDSRECTNYFKSFYCRRALRIFPLYYTFLLVAFLVFPHIVRTDWMPLPSDRWLYVCYVMNWLPLWHEPWHANILGHFWSLSVEEQFYFVWPLVVLAVRPRLLLRLAIAMELAMVCGRCWWVWSHGPSTAVTVLTITRMDGLLLGAACAVMVRELSLPQGLARVLPWAGTLCLTAFVTGYKLLTPERRGAFTESVGIAILATGFAAVLLAAVLTDSERTWLQTWLRWRPLTRFGKYAYGIYVFHVPIYYFLDQFTNRLPIAFQASFAAGYFLLAVKFAISFGAASLSYNLFEKKFLLLKDRFEPAYNSARVATASA